MDYEKKYKEAIELMKDCIPDADGLVHVRPQDIFPELEESEDERIREAIHIYLDWLDGRKDYAPKGEYSIRDMIAWLKKQDKQKHTPKPKVGDTIYYNSFGEVKSMIVANVTTDSTNNPMYEDENGNAVFEEDLIEQKSTWTPMDKQHVENLLAIIEGHGYPGEVTWLNSLEDRVQSKQGWSEEDEMMIKFALTHFRKAGATEDSDIIKWLKSLKDRVQPQPKQEWSNWDKTIIESIEALCDEKIESVVFQDVKEHVNDIKDWLKSLNPQSTWKPSEKHYELEEFAKIVRGNLTGISKAVQKLFEAKYLKLTGNKMYGGFKD